MTERKSHLAWWLVLLSALPAGHACGPSPSPASEDVPSATAEPAYTEEYIDVGGVRTRYLEAGRGDALVLVHGGNFGDGVSADRWDRNIPELARRFHVFALDRLGQGFTDNPRRDEDYTMDAVVRHSHDFIRALGLSRIHLIGASRGAYVTARLALEHPELIRTLIVCNTGSLAPETGDPNRRDRLVLENRPDDPRGAEVYRLKQLSYSDEHITSETIDLAMKLMESPKNREARARKQAMIQQFEQNFERRKEETLQSLRTGALQVPILLTWGYNDGSAIIQNGMALFEIVAQENPNARMYIMNRAGHYNYRELPEEFNRVVTNFILAHEGS